jgi:hypothetical protein
MKFSSALLVLSNAQSEKENHKNTGYNTNKTNKKQKKNKKPGKEGKHCASWSQVDGRFVEYDRIPQPRIVFTAGLISKPNRNPSK